MKKNNYNFKDINIGDLISIYIKVQEGGSSMGPDIEGNPKYLKYVVFSGMIGNSTMGQAYFDNCKPVGIPLSASSIYDVKPGKGLHIIKETMRNLALKVGRWAIQHYIDQFNEFPLEKGHIVGTSYDYIKINKSLGIRNNNKILKSSDLSFDNWNIGDKFITVNSSNGKTLLAIEATY